MLPVVEIFFCNFQTVIQKLLQQVRNITLPHRWLHLNLGLAVILDKAIIFYSTITHPYSVTLGWSNNLWCPAIIDDIPLMQLLLIFMLFLLKILCNLLFSEKCFFSKLKKNLTDLCFYINRLRSIELYGLALSLFLIKIFISGGFRCIYRVLFESTFFQSIIVRWYCFVECLFIAQ